MKLVDQSCLERFCWVNSERADVYWGFRSKDDEGPLLSLSSCNFFKWKVSLTSSLLYRFSHVSPYWRFHGDACSVKHGWCLCSSSCPDSHPTLIPALLNVRLWLRTCRFPSWGEEADMGRLTASSLYHNPQLLYAPLVLTLFYNTEGLWCCNDQTFSFPELASSNHYPQH